MASTIVITSVLCGTCKNTGVVVLFFIFLLFLGLLYMIGVIGFAAGWGAKRVMDLCGTQSDPFVSADCQTGMYIMLCALQATGQRWSSVATG